MHNKQSNKWFSRVPISGSELAIWLGVAICTIVMLGALLHMFVNSSVFVVRDVQVNGTEQLAESTILRLSGLDEPRNVLTCRESRIEQLLVASPWIHGAEADVSWRGEITLQITERKMVASAIVGGSFVGLDIHGRKIAPISKNRAQASAVMVIGYSQMSGPEVAAQKTAKHMKFLRRWNRHSSENGRPSEIHLDEVNGPTWVFGDGVAVRWNAGLDIHRINDLNHLLEEAGKIRGRISQITWGSGGREMYLSLRDGQEFVGTVATRMEQ